MYVDSHCHLHFIDFNKLGISLSDVVQNAYENQVSDLLCVATHSDQHTELLKINQQFPSVKISFGFHPEHADQDLSGFNIENWFSLASDKAVIGIGETGLDYYHINNHDNKKQLIITQQKLFIKQIYIAKTINKPLIVHTRMAREDTINILSKEQAYVASGVMHCFTEDWFMAKQALDLGFYISFSGIITFNNAQDLREVVKKVPLDRILIETDCPFLAPVPFRGKINQPSYVRYVAEKIATIKNISVQEVGESTSFNYKKLFKII